jgi:hypothetical protein
MDLPFLDLSRFRARPGPQPAPTPVFQGLAQVRAYWEGLRNGGAIPNRLQLDPRGLGGVLDRVFLAERVGRGILQVRIAGSGLAEFAGLDLRGLPLSCLFAGEARSGVADLLEEVAAARCLAELDLASDRGDGRAVARMLLLPLAEDQDRRMVLGALSFAEGAQARCKFTLLRRQVEPLASATPQPVAAEAPRKPGHLRLVHARD